MQNDFESKMPQNLKPWAEDLACPICFAALRFSESTVVCTGCARSYPVVDNIPVLIPQRATLNR
jgi:uncharacterized protein YbaR (Trm112 family)